MNIFLFFSRKKKPLKHSQHLTKCQLPHQICSEKYPAEKKQVANVTLCLFFKPAGLSQGMTDVWVEKAERVMSSDSSGGTQGSEKSGNFQSYRKSIGGCADQRRRMTFDKLVYSKR